MDRFNQLHFVIGATISDDIIAKAHNGNGYFNGMSECQMQGWSKGVDEYGRKIIFFRKDKKWFCVHERYGDRSDVIVASGYYFSGQITRATMDMLRYLYAAGTWRKQDIDSYTESKCGSDNDEFTMSQRKQLKDKLLLLADAA